MFKRLRRAWLQHVLFQSRVPYPVWHEVLGRSALLAALSQREKHKLRKLTSLFLREKAVSSAADFVLEDWMPVLIAAHACLLVLNFDDALDYYDGWSEIIVYPGAFRVKRQERGMGGVVHETNRALAGESWSHGPVVLSWDSIASGGHAHGLPTNVILHEFAHKLDMFNGPADGLPPLHRGMVLNDWTTALSSAYENLTHRLEHHHQPPIDPYGATNPAEFFAVITEVFFEAPAQLRQAYPEVYQQLRLYYKQDPITRHPELLGSE